MTPQTFTAYEGPDCRVLTESLRLRQIVGLLKLYSVCTFFVHTPDLMITRLKGKKVIFQHYSELLSKSRTVFFLLIDFGAFCGLKYVLLFS